MDTPYPCFCSASKWCKNPTGPSCPSPPPTPTSRYPWQYQQLRHSLNTGILSMLKHNRPTIAPTKQYTFGDVNTD